MQVVDAKDLTVRGGMSVHGPSNFVDEVLIDSTLTVRGSVIGSGPYVDSSDARFKRNVTPLGPVLEAVTGLTGVKYSYDKDTFPERNFPSSRQIGWLADEVETVFPELVEKDNEGYRFVAYSHASAIIAEALKELKEESRREINLLRKRIEVLEDQLAIERKQTEDGEPR